MTDQELQAAEERLAQMNDRNDALREQIVGFSENYKTTEAAGQKVVSDFEASLQLDLLRKAVEEAQQALEAAQSRLAEVRQEHSSTLATAKRQHAANIQERHELKEVYGALYEAVGIEKKARAAQGE